MTWTSSVFVAKLAQDPTASSAEAGIAVVAVRELACLSLSPRRSKPAADQTAEPCLENECSLEHIHWESGVRRRNWLCRVK